MKRKHAVIISITFIIVILVVLFTIINGKGQSPERINYNPQLFSKTIYNQPLQFDSQAKTTILLFFTTECELCKQELNYINNNYYQLTQKAKLIFISYEDEVKLKNYFLEYSFTGNKNFNVISDPNFKILDYYKISGFPTTLVFDQKGKNIKSHSGVANSLLQNLITSRQYE